MADVIVYSEGVIACSVCVPKEMTTEEIERIVNIEHPTQVSSDWKISKDTHFACELLTNPCICDDDSERKHYLLNC